MKETVKRILKSAGYYHSLQSAYRNLLFFFDRTYSRIIFQNFKGSGFNCNVCGNAYTQFKAHFPAPENAKALADYDVIAGYGKNILCPFCLSNARERLIIEMLKTIDLKEKKILHLSPEKNVFNCISKYANVTTADLLPGFYKTIDKNIVEQNATKFSFADNSFDLVIGNHILEHIPDDIAAVQEIFRILKKGGQAILQVPYSETITHTLENKFIVDPKLQSELFGQKDHVRIYALTDYILLLKNAGFEVEILSAEELNRFKKYAIQEKECFLQIRKVIV